MAKDTHMAQAPEPRSWDEIETDETVMGRA
jgi:hypothetical protein